MTQEQHWRQKYEQLIAEQERQEKAYELQQAQWRRALVRVSLAVEGFDDQLDRELGLLRESLRSDETGAALDAAIDTLEASLLQFETQRSQQWQVCQTAMVTLLQRLPSKLDDQAKSDGQAQSAFCRTLTRRIRESQPQEIHSLLQALAEWPADDDPTPAAVQRDSLDADSPSAHNVRGWLNRLWRRPAGETAVNDAPATPSQPVCVVQEPDSEVLLEGELLNGVEVEAEQTREAVFQRPVHEPAFSRVSDKVQSILTDLLDRVEPVGCTEQKSLAARQRLARGMNWYELVPTLEDIRDLVLQAYLMADEEYRAYLQGLDNELAGIISALDVTSDAQQDWLVADEQLHHCLSQQLGALGRSVSVATEVHTLQQDIHSQLHQIHAALQHSQSQKAQSQAAMEAQLCRLTERLQALEQQAHEASQALTEARQQALTDGLTGLPNREAYTERAHLEWQRWRRYGEPLALVVCDIDHFKSINDRFGHQAGDRVLQVLSKGLLQRLRSVDFMARYGGEEFVLLLPNTTLTDAHALMDKMRSVIASTPFRFKSEPLSVTVSMGVVALAAEETLSQAFARADQLLYKAKSEGRNRCLCG